MLKHKAPSPTCLLQRVIDIASQHALLFHELQCEWLWVDLLTAQTNRLEAMNAHESESCTPKVPSSLLSRALGLCNPGKLPQGMRQLQPAEVLQKTRSWLSLTASSQQSKSQLRLSNNKVQFLCNSWHEDKEANRAGCKELGEQPAVAGSR